MQLRHVAAALGVLGIVAILPAPVRAAGADSPLIDAIKAGDREAVRTLLKTPAVGARAGTGRHDAPCTGPSERTTSRPSSGCCARAPA